jgi:hypothetical protein
LSVPSADEFDRLLDEGGDCIRQRPAWWAAMRVRTLWLLALARILMTGSAFW